MAEAPAVSGILGLIGNTPLVEIARLNPNPGVRILAKLEGYNPCSSVKDCLENAQKSAVCNWY